MTGWATGGRVERGSAGLLAVWVALVVLAVTTAALVWGAALVTRHRAAQAADLAALAAASHATSVAGPPCSAAERVASSNRAELTVCDVLPDGSVLVAVELAVPGVLPGLDMPPARARARAGALPVDQRSR
jgi:secretion/DNA translocation related TadE-like protein